jgi:cell wall-associated NlpC family hydrolase
VTQPATSQNYINLAVAQNGKPYVYATQGPDTFDCSGLVLYCCEGVGITDCPRTSEDQWDWVQRCTADQIEPGVLVFSNFPGEVSPGHVQIAIGYGPTSNYVGADNPSVGVEEGPISGDATGGGVIVGYGYIPGLQYVSGVYVPGNGTSGSGSGSGFASSPSEQTGGVEAVAGLVGIGLGATVLIGLLPVIAVVVGVTVGLFAKVLSDDESG